MVERRPNPDALLHSVQEEERQQKHGKLKIYLGAAPGVGKTHEMLHDALELLNKGLDVVVGIAESHGRQEINSLLTHFNVLPKKTIDYHGKQLSEFDLDGALKRYPGLILVDEMAHTNVPGSRHKKRWQDIKELLDRGIDVYTTLNVQHIESLNDDVSQIVHAPIKETIPDSIIEIADTIELVDLPPEELLKRLQDGKVYFPAQAKLATESFFRKGNLSALRELALRTAAKCVSAQVLLYRQGLGIRKIWPTKEKILVCVGPGISSLTLIRAAKRTARNLQAPWIAIYVDIPYGSQSEEKRQKAVENLRLAKQLGAETRILTGFNVVKTVLDFAHDQNITQIMIWKHIRTRWRDLFLRSLADEILRYSEEIDVYIMTGDRQVKKQEKKYKKRSPWVIYLASLVIVTLTTMINYLLYPVLSASNLIMVYLLGVTGIALFGRVGPSILGSVLSIFAYDYFFSPPLYTFSIPNLNYSFTLLVMLIVTQVISQLIIITRRQMAAARLHARQTSALYELSKQLSNTRGKNKLLNIGINYISKIFNSEVAVFLPQNKRLIAHAKKGLRPILDAEESEIIQWVYELGQRAGLGTDTFPTAEALYLPLPGIRKVVGVLRLQSPKGEDLDSPEKIQLLEACASQFALALEIENLNSIV
ncbi:DUF4118 domain-containing protein [Legionella hackeliae]|uniref:Sensor protein KdpD n=1 Tax=Legionella hackeliae TaxID=449 RepID=A0A0A8UNS1_LEGHA|nr:DUF4118 domain-containing protein [Legionella hackeliae]KTD14203.1 osmosensitive K+ channel His-kinase sensor [Legionella hackeliae]CEK10413.1 Sensor protein KdpD [Legionella hackeliae]STX47148.1 osmosensitive K+ channel His-kinase sensor [Legionella hackeliae]